MNGEGPLTDRLEVVAAADSVLYRCLAEGFGLPDGARLERLERMLPAVRLACDEIAESLPVAARRPDLAALARALTAAQAGSTEDLQADYTHLFLAGYPTTPCRLVESVHLEGTLVGEASETAAASYLRFGLEAKEREPDNLTSELEFLAYLTGTPVEPAAELERYREAQRTFLHEHLLRWGPALVIKIRNATTNQLYLALAELLDWVLSADAARSR